MKEIATFDVYEMKMYLLWSMTNNVVQFEVGIEANPATCNMSEQMLPKSWAHFKCENIWIHFYKEK
jgi:hypothetical protein